MRLICFLLLICFCAINKGIAQNSSLEFWPETDIWYRLSPSWRLSSFVAVTKYRESKYRDLNLLLQADYAWGHTKNPFLKRMQDDNRAQTLKAWLLRGGFMEGKSLGENAGGYSEDMAFAEVHKRIPLKGDVLLSQRFRTDLRWLGQDSDFSYRFRLRVMAEKEYQSGNSSVVPYVNAEPYWDSRYLTINRIRLIGGATVAWRKSFALEGNLTYQYDSKSSAQNVYALNVILHLFFERTKAAVKTGSRVQTKSGLVYINK